MTSVFKLNNIDHSALKVRPISADPGALSRSNVLVFPNEFQEVQKHFPILLSKDNSSGRYLSVAVLGLKKGENLFWRDEMWTQDYMPLFLQKGPFSIGKQKGFSQPQQSLINIDLDHPQVSESEGTPLFNSNGGASQYLRKVSEILGNIEEGDKLSVQLFSLLDELNLLEPVMLELSLNEKSTVTIENYFTVSESKFHSLSSQELDKLHKAGALKYIFMMLFSLSNFEKLIGLKNALKNKK